MIFHVAAITSRAFKSSAQAPAAAVETALAEFVHGAGLTAKKAELLTHELQEEKRASAALSAKLEQTVAHLTDTRASLAECQGRVLKARQQELSLMQLQDQLSQAKSDLAARDTLIDRLRQQCACSEREITELQQRMAGLAEEKRAAEAKTKRIMHTQRFL
jgi:chromosome segregation ATPase